MWAVIGSAGRKEDGPRMGKELFDKAYAKWVELVNEHDIRSGCSGGAAWMDHLLITWGLNATKVEKTIGTDKVALITVPDAIVLHLPCPISLKNGKAFFTPEVNGRWYCQAWEAKTANNYHDQFSRKVFKDPYKSRLQILELITKGLDPLSGVSVHVESGGGLMGRNGRVANDATEGIVAFTFSSGNLYPKDGGTANTWREHFNIHPDAERVHVDLGAL